MKTISDEAAEHLQDLMHGVDLWSVCPCPSCCVCIVNIMEPWAKLQEAIAVAPPETERKMLERALVEAVTNYREAADGDDPGTSSVLFWGCAVDDAAGALADHILAEGTP